MAKAAPRQDGGHVRHLPVERRPQVLGGRREAGAAVRMAADLQRGEAAEERAGQGDHQDIDHEDARQKGGGESRGGLRVAGWLGRSWVFFER